jgi:pimeloyl-ACP methyl ester carboxylesterase
MYSKILFLFILLSSISCNFSNEIQEIEGFLEVKKNLIHYKVAGNGEAILLIHGGYLNLEMWDNQVEDFVARGYQVIRFSDLGHGQTQTFNEECYGHEIIDALLNHLSVQKAHIIGLSWGSMLGVDYSLNKPNKVDKLVLVSPGLNGWDYFQDSVAEQNYLKRRVAIENNDIRKAVDLFYKNWVVGPRRSEIELDEVFKEKAKKMIEHTMTNHWSAEWSKLDSVKAIHRLTEINTPTLIINGDQDASDILSISEIYDKDIPQSKIITFKNSAHSISLEKPLLFNKTVIQFLED